MLQIMLRKLRKNINDRFYLKFGKRIFDLLLGLLILILILPLILLIAVIIFIKDGAPVLFIQYRLGKDFKKFKLFKFRTMINDTEPTGPIVTRSGDPRITKTGKFLRKYKIDELPQLWNVIKGEMSLVGPRPERAEFVNQFQKDYRTILSIKPGITDYASLEYRNEEELLKNSPNYEEIYIQEILPRKIQLYKAYIDNISFGTDLKIMFQTAWRIVI